MDRTCFGPLFWRLSHIAKLFHAYHWNVSKPPHFGEKKEGGGGKEMMNLM